MTNDIQKLTEISQEIRHLSKGAISPQEALCKASNYLHTAGFFKLRLTSSHQAAREIVHKSLGSIPDER